MRFADAEFDYEFEHPLVASSGTAVEITRNIHSGGEAVHLSTPDAREVYFELDRYEGRLAAVALQALTDDVQSRFENSWFGEPATTQLCGQPALSIHFRFGGRMRWAIFTEGGSPAYRVILDPRSSTNLAILGTLVARAAGPATG